MNTRDFYLYTLTDSEGKDRCFVSPLPKERVPLGGLPGEVIAGEFTLGREKADLENFKPNPDFIKFIHWAIAKHIGSCPDFLTAIEQRQNGHMIIADMRGAPHRGEVPIEDRIGVVSVKEGKAETFHPLTDYKIMTEKGFMSIDPWLFDKLVDEMELLAKNISETKS